MNLDRKYRNSNFSLNMNNTINHFGPTGSESYTTAPYSIGFYGSDLRRANNGRIQLPKLSEREQRFIKKTFLGSPRLSETAQPGNRLLLKENKISSEQVMMEIVKTKSSLVRHVDTQKGKRSPILTGHDTATKTTGHSGDFELSLLKQQTSTISQSRHNSISRGQNERFKNSPLMSMRKYPAHVMK